MFSPRSHMPLHMRAFVLKKSSMNATNVRQSSLRSPSLMAVRGFMQEYALNMRRIFPSSQTIRKLLRGITINAVTMEEPLSRSQICSDAREFILEKNPMSTVNVRKTSLRIQTLMYIKKFILGRNTLNVLNVEKLSQGNQH
uniref:Macaca fascicularis brain cDNA clone: QflA-18369, similar to human KRAB box containing C2H2 type zinc finger bA526D8.4(BA526D8.4), mRNA, RefSeq: XM_046861.3 n=1 Tax=Macaca fascicularis TaxID=9541 RepID=I7GIA3_MACFA|nr:unnamed protein product [Macaca fascicularis]